MLSLIPFRSFPSKNFKYFSPVVKLWAVLLSRKTLALKSQHFVPTDEQNQKSDRFRKAAFYSGILAADHASAGFEWMNHNKLNIIGEPITAVHPYIRWDDLGFSKAKEAVKRKFREYESEYLRLRQICWEECGDDSRYGEYLSALPLQVAGSTLCHLDNTHPSVGPENPLAVKPKHKLEGLRRKLDIKNREGKNIGEVANGIADFLDGPQAAVLEPVVIGGASSEQSDFLINGNATGSDPGTDETVPHASPWLANYPKLSDEVAIELYLLNKCYEDNEVNF
ncbi:hypothetical protein TWF281_009182 [Arthrobotrys megalospora]